MTMDLLLHPALEESFGVVVAEAMALGLGVVAGAASGAVPWVVGPVDAKSGCAAGVLTDVRDASSIASALAEAFDNRCAVRSAIAVRQTHARFSSKAVVDLYAAEYARVFDDAAVAADGHEPGLGNSAC